MKAVNNYPITKTGCSNNIRNLKVTSYGKVIPILTKQFLLDSLIKIIISVGITTGTEQFFLNHLYLLSTEGKT